MKTPDTRSQQPMNRRDPLSHCTTSRWTAHRHTGNLLKRPLWAAGAALLLSVAGLAQQDVLPVQPLTPSSAPASRPAASAPASQPGSTFRRPIEAIGLEDLLREREARPILPTPTGLTERGADSLRPVPVGRVEGSLLAERSGRFLRENGRSLLEFIDDDGQTRRLEVLANQYLEAMEDEASRGVTEFVVSAEVTRYRGENLLLVRKLLRRVSNGNLSP